METQISSEKAPSIELLTLEDKAQNNLSRLRFVNFKQCLQGEHFSILSLFPLSKGLIVNALQVFLNVVLFISYTTINMY